MLKNKSILFIFLLAASLFLVSNFAVLAQETEGQPLEITYPEVPGLTERPTSVKTALPDYVKYLFNFAVMISGLVAFAVLIFGGARYATSAGEPAVMNDAKSQMFAGVLGLVVLLSSYVILTTVNPQLVIFRAEPKPLGGVTLYDEPDCAGNIKAVVRGEEQFEKEFPAESLKFLASKGELEAELYGGKDFSGAKETIISGDKPCVPRTETFDVKGVKLTWKLPGVYLVNEKGQEILIPSDTGTIGKEFNDKVKGIKFRNIEAVEITNDTELKTPAAKQKKCNDTGGFWENSVCYRIKYGAVLHEDAGQAGSCKVFTQDGEVSGFGVSSVTVFILSGEETGEGVTFYEHENMTTGIIKPDGPFKKVEACRTVKSNLIPWVTSMNVDGNYLAVLFSNNDCSGICQVFRKSDPNFRNDPIGRCGCLGDWFCGDCLRSFIILPVK